MKESWNSKLGVILAVAGGAVGLGNFLRFPGQIAQYGGGAFMIAYFLSLIVIGLPIGWAEWTMGRYGGQKGFSTAPGVFNIIWKRPFAKYFGVLAIIIPLGIFTYYVYIQAWCLGYAINYLFNNFDFKDISESKLFWENFVGMYQNGSALGFGIKKVGIYIIIVFVIDFFLISKGLVKGIESFTSKAIPLLLLIAIVITIRVLALGTPNDKFPENNINNGLGFMWNPNKEILYSLDVNEKIWVKNHQLMGSLNKAKAQDLVIKYPNSYKIDKITIWNQLQKPRLWLAASSQIFLSLCLGSGLIIVYSSYMKKDEDIVLSNLTATSTNEFSEVALGGLMTIPASFSFLGSENLENTSSFSLGFNVLPIVFSKMQFGQFFGFLFFFLLFLASISGILAMLQPGKEFLKETLEWKNKNIIKLLFLITFFSSSIVFWYTKELKALETFDFWITFLMFIMVTFEIITFSWKIGVKKGIKEANRGSYFNIPKFFYPIFKYLCPFFLLTIFILWILLDALGLGIQGVDNHIIDLFGSKDKKINPVAWICLGQILISIIVYTFIISKSKKYK